MTRRPQTIWQGNKSVHAQQACSFSNSLYDELLKNYSQLRFHVSSTEKLGALCGQAKRVWYMRLKIICRDHGPGRGPRQQRQGQTQSRCTCIIWLLQRAAVHFPGWVNSPPYGPRLATQLAELFHSLRQLRLYI